MEQFVPSLKRAKHKISLQKNVHAHVWHFTRQTSTILMCKLMNKGYYNIQIYKLTIRVVNINAFFKLPLNSLNYKDNLDNNTIIYMIFLI